MAEALTHNLKLIGRYSILRELRRDRFTAAYLAFDPVLDREVFVKAVQLRASGQPGGGDDRLDQAFTRQAQAAGRLHHPHIVSVFDAGRVQNVGYLALEKVDGPVLADALAQGFRAGPQQAADLVARVAEAVEFAHARGIPHGHLGASRVVLQAPDGVPKVMGFGGWIDTGITGDFELAATEAMLPYFQNELSADARRRDVRALGALLFLLLTGTRPDPQSLRTAQAGDSPIVAVCPTAPFALAEIAEAALGLRGLRPFGSAGAMRQALLDYLRGPRDGVRAATLPAPRPATVGALAGESRSPLMPVAPRSVEAARPGARAARFGAAALALVALAAAVALGLQRDDGDAGARSHLPAASVVARPAAAPFATAAHPNPPAARTAARTTTFGPVPSAAQGTPGFQ